MNCIISLNEEDNTNANTILDTTFNFDSNLNNIGNSSNPNNAESISENLNKSNNEIYKNSRYCNYNRNTL